MFYANISFDANKASIDCHLPDSCYKELSSMTTLYMNDDAASNILVKGSIPLTRIEEGLYSLSKVQEDGLINIPSGLLPKVLSIIKSYGVKSSLTNKVPSSNFKDDGIYDERLYKHQLDLVKAAIKNRRGTLQSPTSSGKSFVLGELCRKFSSNVLVLVPTIPLLYQLRSDIAGYLSVPEDAIGMIGDSIYQKRDITVAIPNSLYSKISRDNQDLIDYLASIRYLLIDECHNFSSASSGVVSSYLTNTHYRLGLSATVWRNDGTDLILEALIGPLIHKVSEMEMIDKGIITQPLIKFYKAAGVSLPRYLQQRANDFANMGIYNKMYDLAIVKNESRNRQAIQIAKDYMKNSPYPVVFIVNKVGTSGGISHASILQDMLKEEGLDFPIIHGKTKKKDVDKVFSDLGTCSIKGAIAGPNIFKEGVSIKSIGCVVLMSAGSSSNSLIQRIGRALRKFDGKNRALIIDFIDSNSRFKSQSDKRMKIANSVYKGCVEVC